MKKLFITIVLTFAYILCAAPLTCRALDFDPNRLQLEYSDAPEGTAYIDILAKLDKDDESYTDFNAAPERLVDKKLVNGSTEYVYEKLSIDESSEIAGYHEDGYASLSIHSADVSSLTIEKPYGCDSDVLKLELSADELYKKYKHFKIAYVGENGEVLGVTKTASVTYSLKKPYALSASGKKAKLRFFGASPYSLALVSAGVIAAVAVPICLIIRKSLDRIRDSETVKRIMNDAEGSAQ